MTELSDFRIPDSVAKDYERPLTYFPRISPSTSTFQDILHGLGKTEEYMAKAIGKALFNDPKYDDIFGSSDYWTQVGFYSLFEDAGINEENLGPGGSILAGVLGLAAALASPDPLNKLKILGLTKRGVVSGHLARETASLKEIAGGIKVFDEAASKTRLDELTKKLDELTKGGATGEVIKNTKMSKKMAQDQVKSLATLNDTLVSLQKGGVTLDDLTRTKTMYEQIKSGERHILGFSSPKKLDQLSLLGFARTKMDNASVVPILPKTAQLAVAKVAGKLGEGASLLTTKGIEALAASGIKMASSILLERKYKEATLAMKKIMQTARGNVALMREGMKSMVKELKLSYEEYIEVADKLEDQHIAEKRIFENLASEMRSRDPDFFSFRAGPVVKEPDLLGPELPSGISSLDEQGRLLLTPSGLDEINDVPRAFNQYVAGSNYPGWKLPNGNQIRLTGDFIIMKVNDLKTKGADLKVLNNYTGAKSYVMAKQAGQDFLIAKRLPGAAKVSKTNMFELDHLANLDALLANLAKKQTTVSRITPEDIIINQFGGVQIINPEILESSKSSKLARIQSSTLLEYFRDYYTGIPSGPGSKLVYLESQKNMRLAPKVARVRSLSSSVSGPSANIDRLLIDGANLNNERAFIDALNRGEDISGFANANGISDEVVRLQKHIAAGDLPNIDPIVVTTDGRQLFIVEGHERLVAAKIAGFDTVPIVAREFLGETLDITKPYYSGRTFKLDKVFRDDGGIVGEGFPSSVDTSFIPLNYKLVTPDGFHLPNTGDFKTPATDKVLSALSKLVTIGLNDSPGKAQRPANLMIALGKLYGDETVALAGIANLAKSSGTRFLNEFQQKVSVLANRKNILNPINKVESTQALNELDIATGQYLDELADRGILTDLTSKDPFLVHRAIKGTGATFYQLDEVDNVLRAFNPAKPLNELREGVDSFFRKFGGAQEIDQFGRVEIVGADGILRLKVSDFVTEAHPNISEIVKTRAKFHITPEAKEALEVEHGIMINKKLDELPQAIGGVLIRTGDNTRPVFPVFFTRSGEIFLSTKYQKLDDAVQAVFGRGPIYVQETGLIVPGKVILQDLLGSNVRALSRQELGIVEKRLKFIAKRLDEMGLAKNHILEVHGPIPDSMWSKLYGTKTTIGDVLAKGWKLNLPEVMENLPLHPDLSSSLRVVGIESPKFKNPNQTKLYDFLAKSNDQMFIDEVLASIPVSHHGSYLARFMSEEAKDAINGVAIDFFDKFTKANPKFLGHWEAFLKDRKFTDLTISEINDLAETAGKLARDGKMKAWTKDDIMLQLIEHAKVEFEKTLDPGIAKFFSAISDSMPSGIRFFYDNPVLATQLRYEAHIRTMARADILGTLKQHGLVYEGTANDIKNVRRGYDEVMGGLLAKVEDLNDKRVKLDAELKAIGNLQIRRRMDIVDELKKLNEDITRTQIEIGEKHAKSIGKEGILVRDMDIDKIYISGDDAARLVGTGKIEAKDFVGRYDDALVGVPIAKYSSALESGGVKVYAFHKDLAPLVNRYFTTLNRTRFTSFLNYWDKLNSTWSLWTLFAVPAFHFRNFLANGWLAWGAGITDINSYSLQFRVTSIISQLRSGSINVERANELMDSIQIASDTGVTMSSRDIFSEFMKRGGVSGGFAFNEHIRASPIRQNEVARFLVKTGGARPSREFFGNVLVDNPMIRGGVGAHIWQENMWRFTGFIDEFRKTGSLDAAETKMKAVFYDYSDLTAFERDVLRRIFPFYAWMRHNIPAQIKLMVTRPDVYLRTQQLFHRIEQSALDNMPSDESKLPDYFKEGFGTILYRGKDGRYFGKTTEGIVPAFDLMKLFVGEGAAHALSSGVTPLIKFPIEQITNYSFFKKDKIEFLPGEPSRSRVLSELGFTKKVTPHGPLGPLNVILNESALRDFFRFGKTAANLIDDIIDQRTWIDGEPFISGAVLDLLLGRGAVLEPEKTAAMEQAKFREIMQYLESAEKYSKETGNATMEGYYKKWQLKLLMQNSVPNK